ncbi:MAG: hypothetical protein LBU94_02610 [Clostridiales bacterium]|jgi:hypothetical protein|nr:hypothetical protein [Clostridiales bacterium]
MKIKKLVIPLIFCSLVSFFCLSEMAMAQSEPGGEQDPVVTKSYVDGKISELESNASSEINEYQMEFIIDEVTGRILDEGLSPTQQVSGGDLTYVPVSVYAGQTILGGEGTEMILRSGSAIGYSSVADGLANTTTGGDVKLGDAVGVNNLLIVPRNDGRGLTATSDIWLLVKGNYNVIN